MNYTREELISDDEKCRKSEQAINAYVKALKAMNEEKWTKKQ